MPDTKGTAPKDFRPSNTSGPTHARTPHGDRTKNTFEMCDPPPNGGMHRQSSQEHYAVKWTLKLVIMFKTLKFFHVFFYFKLIYKHQEYNFFLLYQPK